MITYWGYDFIWYKDPTIIELIPYSFLVELIPFTLCIATIPFALRYVLFTPMFSDATYVRSQHAFPYLRRRLPLTPLESVFTVPIPKASEP